MRISAIFWTPFLAQFARSALEMGREALLTSGVATPTPAQNSLNPSAVLVDRTDGAGNGPDLAKCSATRVLNGYTVDEPTIVIRSAVSPLDCAAASVANMSKRPARIAVDVITGEVCTGLIQIYMPRSILASIS